MCPWDDRQGAEKLLHASALHAAAEKRCRNVVSCCGNAAPRGLCRAGPLWLGLLRSARQGAGGGGGGGAYGKS